MQVVNGVGGGLVGIDGDLLAIAKQSG